MAEHDQTIKQEEYATPVESQDRGLFDFMGKKVEEKKPEEETISHEFEHKVHVTEPDHKVEEEHKEEEKHESLIQKLTRSDSNSSSGGNPRQHTTSLDDVVTRQPTTTSPDDVACQVTHHIILHVAHTQVENVTSSADITYHVIC
ncbi:hypothetical protein LIER_35663 [Lithospermum erythrorhizon]|uniref:Uncharacterized protein n=1 Tax=Lithospermum erythrorhizon TaxID=34254 RepID=A0AAV3NYB1_LITER